MSLLTTCYGPDLDALADEDGGFEAVTTDNMLEFVLRQWKSVAATLGFHSALARSVAGIQHARGGLLGLHSTALAAFEAWHKQHKTPSDKLPGPVRLARAKVRQAILMDHAQQRPDRVWTLDAPAAALPSGACFDRGQAPLSGRAFADDGAAGYFHGARVGKPGSACAWESPVYLSLGTFPWVYGNRLTRTPPGLDWDNVPPLVPAAIAMRLCAGMWQPEQNLRQDARPIVFAYRYYRHAIEPLLAAVPAYDARTAIPGQLYRRGLLLHAEQSSLETHTLAGPLGPLAANAHNYVIRRYAAFFALRRSLLAGVSRLTAEQQQAIAQNSDPCLRPYAPKDFALKLSP
jgi:hypothetical protein